MPAALAIPALIGAGGQIGSAVIGSRAAGTAARTQADAARRSSDLLMGAANRAMAGETAARDTALGSYAPYTGLGTQAAGSLAGLVGQSAPGFTAPTGADVTSDPGYQFRLEQGQKALERSAAARGTLLTGGTAKSLLDYGQGLASQEYGNVYNRRLGEYDRNVANRQQTFANLSSLLGFGYGAQQDQNQLGFNYANLIGQTGLAGAGYGAAGLMDAANANAAGTVARGNVWGGTLGNLGNNLSDVARLYYAQRQKPGTP